MDVSEFLETERKRPFEWGTTDCATTADRWVKTRRGFSPLERYGRTITDEETGRAWLSEGGLADMPKIMRRSRIRMTFFPLPGDIGLIAVNNVACVAIFDGALWHSRDADGFIAADPSHCARAWRI